ncbi:MAG: serine/threonine protein kinase [candidate division Zixibacteria bacterium]|nr:serine/threonine protein kinase [candidate division Zixibacteria bacterium]NIR63484.1 serine/threonine protein kinase [candidate division Zixibacteria bacterium]NIS17727.1 serine/threonine protein kinase [candidate division Zixibacteria bacterium]NIS45439.1 serine/threonine protein kinase [candidate division Zixibacteria bacterium]NIT54043.1 serine/threonine protein kinase [candidate division Zixibacteria bacterium]
MKDLYLAERYELVNMIGSGGGGEVYAVYDKHLKKNLALKLFTNQDSDSLDDNAFFSEYFLIQKLASGNLVKVYDYGYNESNLPFYTMELLDSGNIENEIVSGHIDLILKICYKVTCSLSFLHFFNLIHNDLKPENIKTIERGGEADVKLLDLGLTVNFNPENPDRRLAGTVEYMAPELFESRQPDKKSDLYSLGVIFYKLITGKVPYTGDDPLMIISDKLEKPIPPINEEYSKYPPEFIDLTLKLLEKDPDDRPDSVFEVACEIGKIINQDSLIIDPAELIESLIGIKLARLFERNKLMDLGRLFVFKDEIVLRRFSQLLRARLQGEYYSVFTESDAVGDTRQLCVSPKSVKKALIRVHRLKAGGRYYDSDSEQDITDYNLVLRPEFGICGIPDNAQAVEIDIMPDLEKWFDEELINQEIMDKLRAISSYNISGLISALQDLQDEGIIKFKGDRWDVDFVKFVSWPLPEDLQKKAVESLGRLPRRLFDAAAGLAPMRYGFDRIFVLKYLGDSVDNPDALLHEMANSSIFKRKGENYYFKNEMLRVGLVNTHSPENLKKLHLKAASILEHNGISVGHEERALSLAHNYTCAPKLDDSVKWTLRASEWLISNEKFRVALKMVASSLELAESMAEHTDTLTHQARLLVTRGDIENRLGHSSKSLKSFARIIRMKKRLQEKEIVARAYKYAGDVYKAARDYKKGLRALQKALEIYESLGNRVELSHTYNNIGNIYWVGSKIDLALENYHKALEIQEELNLLKERGSTLNNIGSCYIYKNELDKTIDYYKQSIEIKKQINDRPELARTYNNLGAVYQELGDIPQALVYLYDSLKINREIDSKREMLFNLDNIGNCEISLGHFQKVESLASEGLALARELEALPTQALFLRHLGLIHTETGSLQRADLYLHQARQIVDNISDDLLEFEIYRNFGRLYINLNAAEQYWIAYEKAAKIANSGEDKKLLFALLLFKIEGLINLSRDYESAAKLIRAAEEMLPQVKSDNLACQLIMNRLYYAIETKSMVDVDMEYASMLTAKPVNQTMKPIFLYLQGRLAIIDGLYDRGQDLLSEASNLAETQNRSNLLWKIKYCQGKIERTLLNYEEAYVNFKKAVTILKSMAETINRKDYLQVFLQQPMAVLLKKEIMELAERMGQK